MKKALHEKKEPFLLYRKGELIGWGTQDVRNLIEAANAAVINEETKTRKLTYDEYFKIIIHDWFEIFVRDGITEKVIKHLNMRIQHVRFHHVLKHSESGLPYWRYIADSNSMMTDPELQKAKRAVAGDIIEMILKDHKPLKKLIKVMKSDRASLS